jgi:hypothetical protein
MGTTIMVMMIMATDMMIITITSTKLTELISF